MSAGRFPVDIVFSRSCFGCMADRDGGALWSQTVYNKPPGHGVAKRGPALVSCAREWPLAVWIL